MTTRSSDACYAAEEIAKDQTLDLIAVSLMKPMGLTIRGIPGANPLTGWLKRLTRGHDIH